VESGGPSVGKVGECDVASWHLKHCSPRLCQLRTDGLAPASKYWMYWLHAGDMSLVSLVACSSIDVWLKCTASMAVLGEKLRQVSRATQSCWEVESGALFLGSSASVQLCWWLMKGCYMRTTWDTYGRGAYTDWARKVCSVLIKFPLLGVYRFESPRLSDMSNRLFAAINT
jgi:hypothetical protein